MTRNLKYKSYSIRMNNKTWENLKKERGKLSWNLFLLDLLKRYGEYKRNNTETTK